MGNGGLGGLPTSSPYLVPRLLWAGGGGDLRAVSASAGGSREQSVASVGGWRGAKGAHSQSEWEGDNLFFQSGRAGFHGCVFIPEQAQLPKALTPPTPPAGRPWLLLIEKKTMQFGFSVS